jgi:hypothetical protein
MFKHTGTALNTQPTPTQQRLTCALKNTRLLLQQFSTESDGDVKIKFFVYIGFSSGTTAMFGLKQTLMLLLSAGTNSSAVVWAGTLLGFQIGPYLLP